MARKSRVDLSSTASLEHLIETCRRWEAEITGQKKPVSQSELARAWGVTPARLSQWKYGKRGFSIEGLVLIKRRYRRSWTQIMGLVEQGLS